MDYWLEYSSLLCVLSDKVAASHYPLCELMQCKGSIDGQFHGMLDQLTIALSCQSASRWMRPTRGHIKMRTSPLTLTPTKNSQWDQWVASSLKHLSGVGNQMENAPLFTSVPWKICRSIHLIFASGEISCIFQFLQLIASCPMLWPLVQIVLRQNGSGMHDANYDLFLDRSYLNSSERSRRWRSS